MRKGMAVGLLHSATSVSTIMGSVTQFVVASLLFSVSKFFHPLFRFFVSLLLRLHNNNGGVSKESFDRPVAISEESDKSEHSELVKSEPKLEANVAGPEMTNFVGFTHSEDDSEEKEPEPEFSFSFRFPTFEEFCQTGGPVTTDFLICEKEIEDVQIFNSDPPVSSVSKSEIMPSDGFLVSPDISPVISQFHSEEESVVTDCRSGSVNPDIDGGDGFLSDRDFGEKVELVHDIGEFDDFDCDEQGDSDKTDELPTLEDLGFEKNGVDISMNQPDNEMTSEFLSEEDFHHHQENSNQDTKRVVGGVGDKDDDTDVPTTTTNGSYDSEKLRSKDDEEAEADEDASKLETLWEHQDLIEQLKMELRKVRATGLPTILEESEDSPRISDDLKPWKIDERFHREECMDELHKFYKSYRERMRKFDIFNYQKMYAVGFLQLKDPLEPISGPKPSGPTFKSLLSQNFWPLKPKSNDSDPMIKFMQELQSDLEVVYVGQMCLSWEFLHWQYGKALDLWDSDPRGTHRYNEVAGEFQQFQVLLQRFIENEHFQGPRVQYYIKQRCLFRNLLQVPVIKEDSSRDKRKGKGERDEYIISSEMLVEILEESIRIFWRFVRADRDCSSPAVKGHKGIPAQVKNPDELELLMEIKRVLHKKEKKLKDIVRSGNCILRKFRQCHEDDVDQVLYFFSQVDMKLVSRVLNMTKITSDQLVWCHSKLSRINFENRKIQVDPSFLLFPCQ
ncbi:OLC1v1009565C2 [Oldenlandia corymbosa var. corymbosa]|nr:OLC1v1009565C2 [Oldenlandia corymbosa var. corymbosa]